MGSARGSDIWVGLVHPPLWPAYERNEQIGDRGHARGGSRFVRGVHPVVDCPWTSQSFSPVADAFRYLVDAGGGFAGRDPVETSSLIFGGQNFYDPKFLRGPDGL